VDFESALYTELVSVAGIGKVFPLNAIEGTKAPFAVYESSDGIQEKTLSGFVASTEIEGSIYIIQDNYASAKTVSKAVISLLQHFQGRIIGGTGPKVLDVSYKKVREIYDPQLYLYQVELEFTISI
jgi:hypothetical protein